MKKKHKKEVEVKVEESLPQFLYNEHVKIVPDVAKQIESQERDIRRTDENIETYSRETESHKKRKIILEKTLEELKKKKDDSPAELLKEFEIQLNKIAKHSKVENIKQLDGRLIIDTSSLTYKRKRKKHDDISIELGKFKFFIFDGWIKAINIENHYKGHGHPCFPPGNAEPGGICMGSAVQNEISKYFKEGNIAQIVFLLINFLEEPNYRSPHCKEENFHYIQKINAVPDNDSRYIDSGFWYDDVKWDEGKYRIAQAKIGNNKADDDDEMINCDECGYDYDSEEDSECPNCGERN